MKTEHTLELISPENGETFRELIFHCLKEAESKLVSTGKVQQEWKRTSLTTRIEIVENAMDYFQKNQESIARDITLQMGKPIKEARNEVQGMIHRSKAMCGLARGALKDITLPEVEGYNRFICREPLGVVLNIAAWNYPLLIVVNVVVPAVLAGNAVAIKHSSLTPLCAKAFEDAFKYAEAPDGLVNSLIIDHKTTKSIIQSDLIHHVAFTGSVDGGKRIHQSASGQFIDVSLELGGKDPAYVREDSNLESTVLAIMEGVFYNAGQSCCAVERIYVHTSLFDKFVELAVEFMNQLKIGNPLIDVTDIGPLAQKAGIKIIDNQLKDAKDKGANIIHHPGPMPDGKQYLLPAIVTNVNHEMQVMMEETFGPIVGIMGVESDKEAISLMNDSPYGLTASVWTNDAKKGLEIGNCIDTGTFFMNRCDFLDPDLPWVGMKNSGRGCTLSTLGLQQLTRPKSYNLKLR